MRTCCGRNIACVAAAVIAATGAVHSVSAGDLATSSEFAFWLDTTTKTFVLSSQADVDSFAAHSVTYRAGETVTAINPDNAKIALVAPEASSAGSVAFTPSIDGLWRLENSNGAVTLVGVTWGVFGQGWTRNFTALSPFQMHTVGHGPDRKAKRREIPPVSYSGDDWMGDLSAAASLTFVSPSGSETSMNLAGTGAQTFTFSELGDWTVRFVKSDGQTRNAVITVRRGGIMLSFH